MCCVSRSVSSSLIALVLSAYSMTLLAGVQGDESPRKGPTASNPSTTRHQQLDRYGGPENPESPSQPRIETEILFQKPPSAGQYRIPGIVALDGETVLVFCADRKGVGDFGHETTTVIRRSTDGGRTWGPIRTIAAREGADIHSGPVVYDRDENRLFKFCRYWPAAKGAKRITDNTTYEEMVAQGWIDHVQTSDDGGISWTEPKPIKLDYPPHVYTAATGNGIHGIQRTDGRLLIQAGYSERKDGQLLRRCCIFASDDDGQSWQRVADIDTADINTIREFVMAEKRDGSLYCNIRSTQDWRAIFQRGTLRHDDSLRDMQCHAGLDTWWREGGTVAWAFSHPAPVGAARSENFARRRQRLVLRISADEGQTWPGEIVVHEAAAAYSDVAVLPDGTALVIFENGDVIGKPYQRVSVARVLLR